MTVRKAVTLALHLPAGAQTWLSMGADSAWEVSDYLMALIADLLAAANWQRGDGKGKRPQPLDRPADMKKQRDRVDKAMEKAAAFRAIHGDPTSLSTPPQPSTTTARPRDARGRFVSRKG